MNIVLFAAPGILGPNMLASLCRRGRERIKCLVLATKAHSLPNDDLIAIAQYAKVPYLAPTDLSHPDFLEKIKAIEPDVLLVASYDTKLPPELLSIPKYAAVNVHPSLLPLYRGACPEFWAIRNGETKTGVTLHDLTEKFDGGDIVLQKEIFILPNDTLGMLLYKISDASFEIVSQFFDSLHREEKLPRKAQDSALATHAPLVNTNDLKINWKDSSFSIVNLIRAANPLGGAWTVFRGFHLKIWQAEEVTFPELQASDAGPGSLIPLKDKQKLLIATGDGFIELKTIQYALFYIIDGWSFSQQSRIKNAESL